MQQHTPGTPKEKLRAMRILCTALVSGVVVFSILVIAVKYFGAGVAVIDKKTGSIFVYICSALAVVCLLSAIKIYNKEVQGIRNSPEETGVKLDSYRNAIIKYMALCEGPALFGAIIFFLTGNYLAFIEVAVMTAAMYIKIPKRIKLADELNLGTQEQILLDQ